MSVIYKCKCDCGNIIETIAGSLTFGDTTSCGCSRRKKYYKEISSTAWTRIKGCAKERNIRFHISKKYAWNLFLKQNRKCALSGIAIKFAKHFKDKDQTASLDRIDSSKGYIKDNVQWTHKDINQMKMEFDESKFEKYVKEIYEFKKLNLT